jgi:hypothetical protein
MMSRGRAWFRRTECLYEETEFIKATKSVESHSNKRTHFEEASRVESHRKTAEMTKSCIHSVRLLSAPPGLRNRTGM